MKQTKPISIHDVKTQSAAIQGYHARAYAAMNAFKGPHDMHESPFDLKAALYRMKRRVLKHQGRLGKYSPHQGTQECARRRAQMGLER